MNKHKVEQTVFKGNTRLMVQQTYCRPLPQNLIVVMRWCETAYTENLFNSLIISCQTH